jgi:RecA-family ATPase
VSVVTEYSGKFRLYKLSDFKKLPAMRWFIKPLVPRYGITLLFGEAKIGKKTFLGISQACAIATGTDWCGFRTTKGKVLYIVGEGFFGVLRRVAAWEKLHGVQTGDNLRLLRVPINFFSDADVENALAALQAQGFEPDFVVIDTLARSMSGGKENATEDMSKVFELIDYFRAVGGGAGSIALERGRCRNHPSHRQGGNRLPWVIGYQGRRGRDDHGAVQRSGDHPDQ